MLPSPKTTQFKIKDIVWLYPSTCPLIVLSTLWLGHPSGHTPLSFPAWSSHTLFFHQNLTLSSSYVLHMLHFPLHRPPSSPHPSYVAFPHLTPFSPVLCAPEPRSPSFSLLILSHPMLYQAAWRYYSTDSTKPYLDATWRHYDSLLPTSRHVSMPDHRPKNTRLTHLIFGSTNQLMNFVSFVVLSLTFSSSSLLLLSIFFYYYYFIFPFFFFSFCASFFFLVLCILHAVCLA